MARKTSFYIMLFLLVMSPVTAVQAEVPRTLGYQGFLTFLGDTLNSDLPMDFEIFTAVTGGSSLWSETQNPVAVRDGYFSVSLGESTPIPNTLNFSDGYFLEITVDGQVLTPRQKLDSVPYAKVALGVESRASAPGTATDGSLYFDPTGLGAFYGYDGDNGWQEIGAVDSVNGEVGIIILDADDLDDTSTAHKFVTSGDLTNLSNLSGVNTGDVTITDSGEIDFTLAGQNITASIIAGSIDETKLNVSINTSLDLADSALQSGDNVSELVNDSGYLTSLPNQTLGNNIVYTGAIADGRGIYATAFGVNKFNFTRQSNDLAINVQGAFGVNTNNNGTPSAAYDFVIDTSGNVGIGTTTPDKKLTISQSDDTSGIKIYGSSVPTNYFNMYLNTQGNPRFESNAQMVFDTRTYGTGGMYFRSGTTGTFFNDAGARNTSFNDGQLYLTNTGNVGIGTLAPTAKLEVAGLVYQSGLGNSTYFGDQAGVNDDLSDNQNVGVGFQALNSNTTGSNNVASGYQALFSNTTGSNNVASGFEALRANTTGLNNVASGAEALRFNTTGINNVASGYQAGKYIADGLTANATSGSSVYLGSNTKALTDGVSNEVVIGFDATGLGSNSVVLGNDSITTTALKGNVGIGTTTPSSKLNVVGNSTFNGQVTITNTTTLPGGLFLNPSFSGTNMSNRTWTDGRDWKYQNVGTIGWTSTGSPAGQATDVTLYRESAGMLGITGSTTISDNLGVGTVTPSAGLHILKTTEQLRLGYDASNYLSITTDATGSTTLALTGTSPEFTFSNNLNVTGTLKSSTLLGGATNLTTDVSGNIIRDPSDIKLKKNIETLSGSLEKVLKLRGVSYEWKDPSRFGVQTEIGFIAQEVEDIVPEVVRSGGEYKSINTRNLIAVVVGAIQEMYESIQKMAEVITSNLGLFDKVKTQELCVGEVCLNEEQLLQLIQGSDSEVLEDNNTPQTQESNNQIQTTPEDDSSSGDAPDSEVTSGLDIIPEENPNSDTPPEETSEEIISLNNETNEDISEDSSETVVQEAPEETIQESSPEEVSEQEENPPAEEIQTEEVSPQSEESPVENES